MRSRDLVRAAARNAFRSKLRTTLTVLSLFVGAFTLTLTTALGAGVNDYVERQVATLSSGELLLVAPAVSVDSGEGPAEYDPDDRQDGTLGNPLAAVAQLNQEDLDAIAGIEGVRRVEAISQISVEWIRADATEVATRFELSINPTSSIGRSDLATGAQLDQDASEPQILLPEDYVAALGFASPEAAIGQSVTVGYTDAERVEQQRSATVVGIAQTSLFAPGAGANAALTDAITEAQVVPGQPSAWPLAVAYLDDVDGDDGEAAAAIAAVKADLADVDLAGQTVEDQLGIIQTVINGIVGVLSAFAVIALVAASFGIVNTLLMSVQERTREIGLMKAMGMSNGRVFGLFSLEAVIIGFLGSVLGAGVAIVSGTALAGALSQSVLADLPGLQILRFEPITVVAVIAVIMLVAFVSGVLPARRAARQDPIESLRYE